MTATRAPRRTPLRVLRIVGLAVGGLVCLLVLAGLAIWLLVDPNDHKARIAAAVQKSTGRELTLPGELKLSLFPWVAIETGAATLGNPPGFDAGPFLSLERARLSVRLLPLLRRQLEVGRIEIDGLDLRLQQNAAGKGNWEDWGTEDVPAPEAQERQRATLDLAGIRITDGRIAFEELVASDVDVDIGRVGPGVSIPVTMQLQLATAPESAPLPLRMQFGLGMDLERQRYQLTRVEFGGRVPAGGEVAAAEWRLEMPAADLDLAAQTLASAPFTARLGDATVIGEIEGAQLIDAPALSGIFRLDEVSPRALLAQLGAEAPVTRDDKALSRLAAQGAFTWRDQVARLTNLAVTLDDSKLTGRLAYDLGNSGMDFALALDAIDLDRYQPPAPSGEQAEEPIELPVELLRGLNANGTVSVGELKFGGARLTHLTANIAAAADQVRLAPLRAQLYGGSYTGAIGIDVREPEPKLTLDEHLRNVDIAALFKDFADSERLSGRGNLDLVVSARGRRGAELMQTLDGRVALDLQGGAVHGLDLWHAIAQAQSLITQRKLAATTSTKRTAFEHFSASAQLDDGVASTRDLVIASQLLRVTGTGNADLASQALDFAVDVTVLKAPPEEGADLAALERATIPVKISGTLTDPKIRPDLAGMVKGRVKQELDERKEGLREELRESGEKVRDRLKDLLRRKD